MMNDLFTDKLMMDYSVVCDGELMIWMDLYEFWRGLEWVPDYGVGFLNSTVDFRTFHGQLWNPRKQPWSLGGYKGSMWFFMYFYTTVSSQLTVTLPWSIVCQPWTQTVSFPWEFDWHIFTLRITVQHLQVQGCEAVLPSEWGVDSQGAIWKPTCTFPKRI